MIELLNVLYVQTQGAVVVMDHDAIRVEVEHETRLRVPVLRLSALVAFGRVTVTPYVIDRFAHDGKSIVWLDDRGRFRARIEGPTRGNVLLRRSQHLALDDEAHTRAIAVRLVVGKIQNSRAMLLRAAREATCEADETVERKSADRLAAALMRIRDARSMAEVRGVEGEAARAYFEAFGSMIRVDRSNFPFDRRSRRPPRDRTNALVSFLYALVLAECSAALEGVGLDPQVGFLHVLRPGRPALALDLLEELRPAVADRLALRLINRRQVTPSSFDELPGGAYYLNEDGRRTVLVAFQRRKEEMIPHRLLQTSLPVGLLPHVQARLLARHLRRDLAEYPPYVGR
jgi:CRISPR-associated protein Cas1